MAADYSFPSPPLTLWTKNDLDRLLLWATSPEVGASDIQFTPGQPVWLRVHGSWRRSTEILMSVPAIDMIANIIGKKESMDALVKSAQDQDPPYEVRRERGVRERFRTNMTAVVAGLDTGIAISLRTIPGIPPSPADLNLPKEIVDATDLDNGLILFTGVMGCHGAGTKLLDASGELVPIEMVEVGDFLMGPDRAPREIIDLHAGMDMMYRVKPQFGPAFMVNAGHLIPVWRKDAGPDEEMDLCAIKDLFNEPAYSYAIARCALSYSVLPIDSDVAQSWYRLGREVGEGLISELPKDILLATAGQRQLLLAGLIDSPQGNRSDSECFVTVNDRSLASNITALSRSLGYRVEVLPCQEGKGYQVCLVVLKDGPQPFQQDPIAIEPAGVGAYYGVEVSGPDKFYLDSDFVVHHNSGKTTSIAAMLRHIRETSPRHVITYEDPPEYDIMGIPNALGPAEQSAIPLHLPSFSRAPRNAGRRAPQVVLLGEMRDLDTMRAGFELTEMGVLGLGTMHTRSVAETMSRSVNVFPKEQQSLIAVTLASIVRLVVQQRLLPSLKGGRVPIWETMSFGPEHRAELQETPVNQIVPVVERMVWAAGLPLVTHARQRFEEGHITEEQLSAIIHERGDRHAG